MRLALVVLTTVLLAASAAAGAQSEPAAAGAQPKPAAANARSEPAAAPGTDEVREPVRRIQAFSTALTCDFPPDTTMAAARRRCFAKARPRLLHQAAAYVEAAAKARKLALSPEEIRAFADSLLTVRVANEDIQKTDAGLRVVLTVRADEDASQLGEKLAVFADSPELRQAAVDESRARRAQNTSQDPVGPLEKFRPGQLEEEAADIDRDMRQTAAFAAKNLRPGMSINDVAALLGPPKTIKQSPMGENYTCFGYGRVWAVFESGLLSCLKKRLDYVRRYRTDCHCAGRLVNIIPIN